MIGTIISSTTPSSNGWIQADQFAEWAYVFDHRYGSPKEPIKEALKDGRDILFDIDWQGTQQLRGAFGDRPGPNLRPAAVDAGIGATPPRARHGF